MKKNIFKSIGARVFAPVLCTIAVLGLAFSILVTALFVGMGGSEKLYNEVYEKIASGYAVYALESVKAENLDELEEYFTERGISCSVVKQEFLDKTDAVGHQIQIFSCGEVDKDSLYWTDLLAGAYYEYNIDSLIDAIFSQNYYLGAEWYTIHEPVLRVVFDKDNGYFYYETEDAFYEVEEIVVYEGGSYIDYILTSRHGTDRYYNGYYGAQLDTTTYKVWDYVTISGVKMRLTEDVNYVDMIHVVSSDQIYEKGFGGFYVDANLSYVEAYPEETDIRYTIQLDWDETAEITEESLFTEWQDVYERLVQFEKLIIPNIIVGFVLLIAGIILLIYSAKDEKEKMGILHKAPVAMYSGVLVFVEFGLLLLFMEGIWGLLLEYGKGSVDLCIVLGALIAGLMLWIAFTWFQNIVTRVKCRSFWKTTEVYYAYVLLKKSWKFAEKPVKKVWKIITSPFRAVANTFREVRQLARENTPLFVGGLVVLGLISFVEWLIVISLRWNTEQLMWFFILAKVVEGALLASVLLQMQRLHEGGKRIAAGDYSMPVDTQKMFWKLKEHGENINKVGEGISLAVNERMKSEHFKTELITNVSHDIKTPLTSIINYVDLIKKEDVQDEKVQEYVEVLDRQSARLKKLIEDLMEASKASTGNLAVNLEECDVEVLLTQVIGEFEEKLQKNQLEVVVDKPEHPVKMLADGRHMWRVLDNLLNNACKYSLPGSRVYVSLKQEGSEAIIVFKNISKTALNIPSEELMERFVRGDSSRNTEGSGLGLSIAQSLTELMQGSMKLEIDGDLFKVTLRFPMLTIQ